MSVTVMTHWRKASPPQIPSPKVAVVCGENRSQGRGLPIRPCLHGRKWKSAVSVCSPSAPPVRVQTRGAGCLRLSGFLPSAALLHCQKTQGVSPRQSARPRRGRTSVFRKATSLATVLGVLCPEELMLALQNLNPKWPFSFRQHISRS